MPKREGLWLEVPIDRLHVVTVPTLNQIDNMARTLIRKSELGGVVEVEINLTLRTAASSREFTKSIKFTEITSNGAVRILRTAMAGIPLRAIHQPSADGHSRIMHLEPIPRP